MKYSITYNEYFSRFQMATTQDDCVPFNNQYDAIDYLEKQGLSEANGDFYYDPIEFTFRFSDQYSL